MDEMRRTALAERAGLVARTRAEAESGDRGSEREASG
jgi:hypothetical protein